MVGFHHDLEREGGALAGRNGRASSLETVDSDRTLVAVAQPHLGSDGRGRFHVMDGAEFLERANRDPSDRGGFDLIDADAWPGKFSHRDLTLSLLRPGGMDVVDDLLPQPTWPAGHASTVLEWASGVMLVMRRAG